MRRGWRILLAGTGLALLPVGLPAGLPTGLPSAQSAPVVAATAESAPAYSETKRLTRSFQVEGQELVIDERDVTVTVDKTTDLRGRERVAIAWSGAHPTGGRAASPFGEQGMAQEYPVVILQCRGLDDPALPSEQQVSPETCWTSTRMQRSLMEDPSNAVWRHDLHASDSQRAAKTGLAEIPPVCEDVESFDTHITPFRAANGTVHLSCTAETMAPEAAVGAAFPPAEIAAYTDMSGNGSAQFEVRSSIENESLGCSTDVACSIVVIPIQGISCLDDHALCRSGGQFESGSSNFAGAGVDAAVSPALWWSESNWRGRFSVPITFGLSPDACDVLDPRAPTGFYGSELMSQAALQWSPAYCLSEDRFKFQHNRMADEAAFALMENGGGSAALVSRVHEPKGEDPVAYAPTAVTGFSVGYVVDRPDNAGEVDDLRLTPRLLAKLITQSYTGSDRGRSHPGMETNPLSINLDPEFTQLNPGLDPIARESAAVLLSLSESSDVLTVLTDYIAADKAAMAFIDGEPDPWGMRVNPSYRKIELPRSDWPLLDDHVPPSSLECHVQNPTPYFTQLAAPVTSLRKIAESVLDGWPNVQTKCDRATVTDPWKIGRVDRQGVGTRFVLGIVSLGDAERLGLAQASLRTTGEQYVAPTAASLARAVALAKPSESGLEPFTLETRELVRAGDAYPGTMVVYTAARTAGLEKPEARKVAQFIEVATTEGQQVGRGNGQLPAGYLPLVRTGATRALHAQAQDVAEMIAEQSGQTDSEEENEETGPSEETPAVGPGRPGTGSGNPPAPPAEAPVDQVPATAEPQAPAEPEEAGPVDMPATVAVSSPVADRLLPTLLIGLFAASLLATLMRLAVFRRSRR